ncbi:MAG: hypothetical protein ACKVW3_15250 [Phycisphaerales bacterium]
MSESTFIARPLPPEDIRPGLFVVVLSGVHEYYPPEMLAMWSSVPIRPLRLRCLGCANGEPRLVLSVCLPFVQAEDARGHVAMFDTRQHELALVNEDFALEQFTRPWPEPPEDDE